jgi:ectoine hydroxylase-related dioxygenase (phytanoyl-CoA dioxygenase family)
MMQIDIKDIDQYLFTKAINEEGYCVVENVLGSDIVLKLREETEKAIALEAEYHGGINYRDYGVVQACPMYGGTFLSILDNKQLMEPFNYIMGEGSILYVYISSSMPPFKPNFSSRVHVDRPRLFPNYCECFAGLIMLDDFTENNGSTLVLPGSHNSPEKPDDDYFYTHAKTIISSAGSVLYFNLRLWHAGGLNNTSAWRHALALGVVRPYLKQKFDLPGMIKKHEIDTSYITDYARQKLGYFAISPSTLDEFYGPIEKRTYKEKSEWEIIKSA